jgi:lysozyme
MSINNIQDQLARDEGNVPYAYQDSLGYWTIGIGTLIDKRKGGQLYPEEISFIFNNRVDMASQALVTKLPWFSNLDDVRRGVLINMTFQMGINGVLAFVNTLKMIQVGNYAGASMGMLNSLWAKQTPERAARLAKQMSTGIWQ